VPRFSHRQSFCKSAAYKSAICYKNNFCSLKEADSPKRLLLDSRVVGFADDIQPNCCHPFLLEALLFQWPKKGVVLLGQRLEHKTSESNKNDEDSPPGSLKS